MITRITRIRPQTFLTALCTVLAMTYMVLMVSTILTASLKTQLGQQVQDARMEIAKLEAQYYDSVAALDATDTVSLGYVTPSKVHYVTKSALPNVAFAR